MAGVMAGADAIADWLATRPRLILDGALATELERRGADLNDALWSARLLVERQELIRAVHLDYFRAGADVATTASYQATFEGFARRGIGHDEAARLMRRKITLSPTSNRKGRAGSSSRMGVGERPMIHQPVGMVRVETRHCGPAISTDPAATPRSGAGLRFSRKAGGTPAR